MKNKPMQSLEKKVNKHLRSLPADKRPELAKARIDWSAVVDGKTVHDLMKLSNKDLQAILKRLKITGFLQASKGSMAREIVRRVEIRDRFKLITKNPAQSNLP